MPRFSRLPTRSPSFEPAQKPPQRPSNRAGRFSVRAALPSSSIRDSDQALPKAASYATPLLGQPELVPGHGQRRYKALSSAAHGLVAAAQISEAVHEPDPVGGGPVVLLGRHQHGGGHRLPGESHQAGDGPVVDHEAQPGRRNAEAGVGLGDPQIAGGDGQLGARPERSALQQAATAGTGSWVRWSAPASSGPHEHLVLPRRSDRPPSRSAVRPRPGRPPGPRRPPRCGASAVNRLAVLDVEGVAPLQGAGRGVKVATEDEDKAEWITAGAPA